METAHPDVVAVRLPDQENACQKLPAVAQLAGACRDAGLPVRGRMGLKIATVCAANMNRSMAAHALLKEEGFEVGTA